MQIVTYNLSQHHVARISDQSALRRFFALLIDDFLLRAPTRSFARYKGSLSAVTEHLNYVEQHCQLPRALNLLSRS